MSGEFRPEQHPNGVESTDDADLARHFGLTDFNRETGLWTAPKAPDAGQRDGEDVQQQRHADAHAEGERQQQEMDGKLEGAGLGGPGDDVTEDDERKPGAPVKAARASQSKAKNDDAKDSDHK